MKNAADRLLLHLLHHTPIHPLALNRLDDATRHAIQNLLPLLGIAGIGKQRRNQRRPRRRQRSPRRPDVQRRDVAVTHVFLVDRVEGYLLQGEGDFDEAFVGHVLVGLMIKRNSLLQLLNSCSRNCST